jgi:hypothetical protein
MMNLQVPSLQMSNLQAHLLSRDQYNFLVYHDLNHHNHDNNKNVISRTNTQGGIDAFH